MMYSLLLIAVVVHKAESDWNRHELAINRSVMIDENTKLVLMGTRHGNRLPSRFIDGNQRTWGFEGNAELTQFGKRQSFGIGKELREFVGSMIGKNYSPKEAKFYTSSANRCQMTLQTLLAGFYRPDTFAEWNPALDWTPVPYSIDDRMLQLYAVKNCPKSDDAWAAILNDTLIDLMLLSAESRLLLDYIANNTGWNASINSASDVADNLIEIDLYGAKYPEWIDNPLLKDYDRERLKKEILAFTEKHQITCAEYEPCRRMMGGVWLHNIITTLERAQKHENIPKLIVFASHTEVTLSVIKLMLIARKDLPTSAGFLIEYRDQPISSVRLLSHDPLAIDDHLIYQADYEKLLDDIADSKHWIPLDKFIALIRKNAISNWEQACDRQSPICIAQKISSNAYIMSSSFIHSSLTAFIILIFFGEVNRIGT